MRSAAICPTVWWPASPQANTALADAKKIVALSRLAAVVFKGVALMERLYLRGAFNWSPPQHSASRYLVKNRDLPTRTGLSKLVALRGRDSF